MKIKLRSLRSQKGVALLIALSGIVMVMGLAGLAIMATSQSWSVDSRRMALRIEQSVATEAGLNYAIERAKYVGGDPAWGERRDFIFPANFSYTGENPTPVRVEVSRSQDDGASIIIDSEAEANF